MQAMILAAGIGSRLKPITDNKPKALIEINGIPMLEIVIKRLIHFGFTRIIINVHHLANQIIDFLKVNDDFGIEILISDESNQLLDTGGAIFHARQLIGNNLPMLIHNVDVLTETDYQEFYHFHLQSDALVSLAVQQRSTNRYFLFDENNILCGWKNDKTGETKQSRRITGQVVPMAFSGIHIIGPDFFKKALANNCLPSDSVCFSIIDVYLCLSARNKINAFDHSGTLFLDMGKHENLQEAARILKNSI